MGCLQAVLRGKIISKSSFIKRASQERLKNLQSGLKHLEMIHKKSGDARIKQEIEKKKNENNEIYSLEIQKKM